MASKFPLQPLLDLSQLHLDEAARELGKLIVGEQEASKRLSMLVQYREEYHARFLAQAKSGIGLGEWSNYTHFLARIDDAIIPAALAVTQTQQQTLAGQQNWMGKHGRVRAFGTLADRHQSHVDSQEQRTEQKASDEHGARRHGAMESEWNPFRMLAPALPTG